jgi:hypothetical protein
MSRQSNLVMPFVRLAHLCVVHLLKKFKLPL